MIDTTDRHQSIHGITRLLDSSHLGSDDLAQVSKILESTASQLLAVLPHDGPMLTSALRHLWQAKNDAVGHAVLTLIDAQKGAPDVTLQPGETHG